MFINQNQLEHLLDRSHYTSARHHQRELEQIFLPGWHLVATKQELARHGDFMTIDLFDRPVQVRNIDGEIHAFLNVCAHRNCLLTHLPCGHNPRFKCQYHGWEYNKEGNTGCIPEAQAFRPFDRENARLKKFRAATAGDLVFVSLAEDGPDLEEYLGPYYQYCLESFDGSYRQSYKWDATYEANWKIPVENSLESYHLPHIHQKTFGNMMPPEENCAHEMNKRFTNFRTFDNSWQNRLQSWWVRRLGLSADVEYWHHHVHPNTTFVKLSVLRMAQVVWPTSPTTSRHFAWVFTARGHQSGPLRALISGIMSPVATWVARNVLREDAPTFPDVQKGWEHTVRHGVIGNREERIFVFQKYILDSCGETVAEVPDNGAPVPVGS
jgi:choline monooxygenase